MSADPAAECADDVPFSQPAPAWLRPAALSPPAAASILLIDGDPRTAAAALNALRAADYTADWAATADQAAASGATGNFDVAILDLGVGIEAGVALIRALRDRGKPLPPLVVFSARPADVQRYAKPNGTMVVLERSCSGAELVQAVAQVLRSRATVRR